MWPLHCLPSTRQSVGGLQLQVWGGAGRADSELQHSHHSWQLPGAVCSGHGPQDSSQEDHAGAGPEALLAQVPGPL